MNLYETCRELFLKRKKKVTLTKEITAADVMAELDLALIATRKAFPIAINEGEMLFLDNAHQALSGFRAYVRSDIFRRKIEGNKKGADHGR